MKYFIETFGCQMNKNDSELMEHSMKQNGFLPSDKIEEADILIFNTCSVRQHAETRALQRLRSAKRNTINQKPVTIVAGCMAQRLGEKLIKDSTADIVIGPYQSPDIGSAVKKHLAGKASVFVSQDADDFSGRINSALTIPADNDRWHRWITITHGCENFCTYCIVPYVRGKLISFSSDAILTYARQLADEGITEITLLGQNVNQYGQDSGDIPFHRLLESAAKINGFEKINFLTSHPKDFTIETAEVIRDYANISRSIHLPLQSGSDKILKAMNRGYTLSRYMELIDNIRRTVDGCAVSTDIITGFPGETVEEYRQTMRALEEIRFDEAFTYAYSSREGTPAFSMGDEIPKEEKLGRLAELIELQRKINQEKLSLRIGLTEKVIPERISKKSKSELMGKTFLNHPVVMNGDASMIGRTLAVKILSLKGSTLYGETA